VDKPYSIARRTAVYTISYLVLYCRYRDQIYVTQYNHQLESHITEYNTKKVASAQNSQDYVTLLKNQNHMLDTVTVDQ